MAKNITALLCATAILGSMTTLSAKADDIVINGGNTENYDGVTAVNGSFTNNGTVEVTTSGNLRGITTLTNNSSISNAGSIVTQAIVNSTGSQITGAGNLTINSGTSGNHGTIEQGQISVGGSLNNSGTLTATTKLTNNGSITGAGNITAASLDNKSTISGSGKLTVSGGSNTGDITKASMETKGDFTNSRNIGTNSNRVDLTNTSGTLKNNGTIKAGIFNNSSRIEGSGTLNVTGGTNTSTGVIAQAITSSDYTNEGSITGAVTNNGTYTNNGSISGSVTNQGTQFTNTSSITGNVTNSSGTFTNNGTIGTASAGVVFNNSSTVDGTGTANIAGGTNSSGKNFTQNNINLTGNYTNNGSMTANNEFTNNSTLSGSGDLTVNDKTGNSSNSGTISQNNVTLGGTFTNSGTLTANGTFTNTATVQGDNGTLNIKNGGTSSGSISQKDISVAGSFENNSTMTSTNSFTNSGNITGGGSISVKNGSNTATGSIAQAITNSGSFTNSGSISGEVTNNGTYTNNGTISGAITNDGTSFTNNNIITGNISNEGGTFTNGTAGKIGDASHKVNITNDATFTNNGSVVAGTIANNTGAAINNNKTITVDTLTNNSTINGANGTLTINTTGTNNGSITQNKVIVASGGTFTNGNGTNSASINAAIENNGTFENKANSTVGSSSNKTSITNNGTFKNFGNVIASLVKNESGKTITNNNSIETDSINNAGIIDGTGDLTTAGGTNSGSITQGSLTNTGTLNHSGSIVVNTINNSGNIQGISDSNGSLTLKNGTSSNTGSMTLSSLTNEAASTLEGNGNLTLSNGGSNEGTISQNIVAVTGGTFSNDNNLTANTLNLSNNAKITGDGASNIAGGTINAGSALEQNIINVTGGTVTNQGTITAKNEFKNAGTIQGDDGTLSITDTTGNSVNNGTITQKDVTLAGTKFTNDGTLTVKNTFTNNTVVEGTNGTLNIENGGSSSGNITQRHINIKGLFSNNAKMTSAHTFTNSGTISGTGSLDVQNGSNTGVIEQAITNAENFTNSGTISGNVTNNGEYTNNGTISGGIISDGTSFTNNNIITGNITNTTGTFTNAAAGKIGDADNKVNITNSDKFVNKGSVVAGTITNNVDAAITNNSTITADTLTNSGDITNTSNIIADTITNNSGASISGGTLQIAGGSNAGSIDVAIAKVTGDFENTNEFIASTFENNSNFTGTGGSLTITDGSKNTGNITQDNVTVNNKLSIASGKSLISKILANKGTITNDNGTITTESISENNTIELKNEASLTATKQTNPLTGLIKSLGKDKTNTLAVTGDIAGTLSVEEGSTLDITNGNVVADAVVNITQDSTFDIKGTSDVTISGNDTWNGKIALDGGSMTVQDRTQNGALVANTGNLTVESGILQVIQGSEIKEAVITTINKDATLDIQNGGKVTLNTGDTWDGKIVLGSGTTPEVTDIKNIPEGVTTLDVSGLDKTGTLLANNGYLKLGDKDLNIHGESYIEKAVAMKLGGNIDVRDGGRVAIDDNDEMTGSEPTVTLSKGGTLNYGKTEDSGLKIVADAGNLNLLGGSNLTFNAGSIADAVAIDIQQDATLTLAGSTLNLDSLDQWNGNIINQNGIINANNLTKSSSTATLKQADGELNLYNDTNLTLGTESEITGGQINITKDKADGSVVGTAGSTLTVFGDPDKQVISGGDMTIDKDSKFVLGSGTFNLDSLVAKGETDADGIIHAALIDTMNGERTTSSIGTLTADNYANFNIDIHARTHLINSNDQFKIGSITGDGTIMIDKWALNGDIFGWDAPIDRNIPLGNHIFLDEDGNPILNANIAVTDHEEFTPIGWYKLNKNDQYEDVIDPDSGEIIGRRLVNSNYSLNLTRFNPQVFRGQVATIAQWQNQLAIDDMLFNHTMLLPSFKEEKGSKPSQAMANRHSAINPLFAPYQYSIKDGGLWYKMYGTFEHLNMNNGLGRVGNNAYGALVGADFGLKDLKNGWKFMPTAYVGYNGAHQYWAGMGQYQNGGQAGFMGTWYKDNFIVSSLTYGGIYDNSMDVHGHNENTFNYFAGTAAKAAYNWRFHKDWVLQPNLMAAYNYFGQQNWHSDFGQMGMMAGMLNGVNIAPGVNLIWEKETFSTYLTLQYMYNVNGAVGGRAGYVGLPQMEMDRGYIQYGIGFTKKFTDRASGYLQAVLRNVGRTGVGFQAGFNIQIGK